MSAKGKLYSKEWVDNVLAMTPEERISLADQDIHAPEGIIAVASACADLVALKDQDVNMRVVGTLLGLVTAAGISPFKAFSLLLSDPVLRRHLDAAAQMQPVPGEKGN